MLVKKTKKKAPAKKQIIKKTIAKKTVVKNKKIPAQKTTPPKEKNKFVKRPFQKTTKPTPKPKDEGKKVKVKYGLLRGMHDILPREEKHWKRFRASASKLAESFRFKRIETPILEEANLFIRSIGKGTEVVDKEMYVFENRDKQKVSLRPEMTASVTRAYIMHGLWNAPQPLKLWYWGPMFRHDRPQAGRYRQFNQVGFEIIGDDDAVVDAELILVAYNFYNDLDLPVEIHINSIGTVEERERYRDSLVEYYRSKRSYLCDYCKKRLNKNPLRLLDCKENQCQPIKEDAPQIIEWLDNNSKAHFTKVLEYLDELEVPYVLNHALVRGLDYYTRTVFEVYPAEQEVPQIKEPKKEDEPKEKVEKKEDKTQKRQGALGGGGRYDLLVEQMGGRPAAAAGFSLGIERSVAYLKQCCEQGLTTIVKPKYDVFIAQLGDQARRRVLRIINEMRKIDINFDYNLSKKSLKGQLDIANSIQVPFALILGQKEVQDNTIIIRDMESGVQEIVDQKKLQNVLLRKLGKVDLIKKK